MTMLPRSRILPFVLALATVSSTLHAQQDSPAIDTAELLQSLRAMREKQEEQIKGAKQRALQDVQNAAASPQAAANAWEEAVRQVQFQGAQREGAQFREWKEKEGGGLRHKDVQNAARLHFAWLGLTIQRALGVPNKDLLPQVIAYTKELNTHSQACEALDAALKHEKELAAKSNVRADRVQGLEQAKKMLDQIQGMAVDGSPAGKSMALGDLLKPEQWENKPSNADGIFEKIILPELRGSKDPRLLEYWDRKLKQEAETAGASKLAFEIDKFHQQRKPELLWSRAQDMLLIGQRNRAISEMFGVIKNHPAHPKAAEWIAKLEELLKPASGAPAAGATAPAG